MDELQARIRTRRSLQTDRNLAEKPYSEFEYSDDASWQGEANVVEMPNRQAQEGSSDSVAMQRPTAKRQQGAAKQKLTTVNQKAFPFRQLRDGHQQPYIDELKRLTVQAERINQLLAERKRKKVAEPLALTDETAVPKKRAAKGRKSLSRSPQQEVSPMPAQDDDTQALEAQAAHIKQLLAALETALIQGDTMPADDATEHGMGDRRSPLSDQPTTATPSPPTAKVEAFASSTYAYGATEQPFSVSSPATPEVDETAQQEATATAQALRYLSSREVSRDCVDPAIAPASAQEARRAAARSRSSQSRSSQSRSSQSRPSQLRTPPSKLRLLPLRRYGLQLRQFLQMPQKSFDKVGDAMLWLVLAAAIRVGARFLLALFPALSPVFMLLMFAPAALAVYLVLFVPRAGFVSIYRLFLVMLGLLLGGRL